MYLSSQYQPYLFFTKCAFYFLSHTCKINITIEGDKTCMIFEWVNIFPQYLHINITNIRRTWNFDIQRSCIHSQNFIFVDIFCHVTKIRVVSYHRIAHNQHELEQGKVYWYKVIDHLVSYFKNMLQHYAVSTLSLKFLKQYYFLHFSLIRK